MDACFGGGFQLDDWISSIIFSKQQILPCPTDHPRFTKDKNSLSFFFSPKSLLSDSFSLSKCLEKCQRPNRSSLMRVILKNMTMMMTMKRFLRTTVDITGLWNISFFFPLNLYFVIFFFNYSVEAPKEKDQILMKGWVLTLFLPEHLYTLSILLNFLCIVISDVTHWFIFSFQT